jgi:hypothetical protein
LVLTLLILRFISPSVLERSSAFGSSAMMLRVLRCFSSLVNLL